MNTNKQIKTLGRQQGMTLIELSVVLLVLIGLAGLTLPYVSGFIGKTHNSTSSDTGVSLFSALQLYQTQNNSLPNNLNTLTDTAGALVNYLDDTFAGTSPGSNFAAAGPVTNFKLLTGATTITNAVGSLKAAGITSVAQLPVSSAIVVNNDGTFTNPVNATFNVETPVALTTTTKLVTDANATTPGADIATALGYNTPSGHTLIVLGVGTANSAVGKTLANVPVHFGDKAALQPTLTYSRFLAAVDVDTANGTAPAKIVGIVHAPDTTDKWESVYSTIAGYYAN